MEINYQSYHLFIVWIQKKSIPTHGGSLKIPRGRGVLRAKILEAMYKYKPEFPGGRGVGDAKQKILPWGMDIF